MRLFLAIEPTSEARAILAGVLSRATDALGPAGAALRWITPENLHLTLQFLGDVEPGRLEPLVASLRPSIGLRPFVVSLDRFGVFPPSGPPRTIWLGLGRGANDVRQIYQELGRRLLALGHEPETRPFSPHLTVARVRDQHRARGQAVRATLASIALPAIEWPVTHASLFESDLSGPRPRYTERGRLELSQVLAGDRPGNHPVEE
jgi:2'-5' RNA ligase